MTLENLLDTLPQTGKVEWIGLRPARRATMQQVSQVVAHPDFGLEGDRYAGTSGKRQVTIIQFEYLAAIASMLGMPHCDPALLRRNIAVSGLNLRGLKDKTFQIGDVNLKYTGLCHPCSFMEETFGPGGYNAVRGHGGITAQVLTGGCISIDAKVRYGNHSSR